MPVATFDWMQERVWPYLLRERRAPQIFVASPAGAVMITFFKRWLCYEHVHGCVNNYFLLRAFRRKCVTRALCAWDARSATGSSRGSPLNTYRPVVYCGRASSPAPPWIMHAERRVLPARSADGRDAGRKWRCRCCRTAANILFVWPSEKQPGPPAIVEVTETPSTVKKVDSDGPARP